MRKIILILSIISLIVVIRYLPSNKAYKYEIISTIKVDDTLRVAKWYANNIQIKGDTIFYRNSDGSEVCIPRPYVLIDRDYQKPGYE